jgi:hypothetical protein
VDSATFAIEKLTSKMGECVANKSVNSNQDEHGSEYFSEGSIRAFFIVVLRV